MKSTLTIFVVVIAILALGIGGFIYLSLHSVPSSLTLNDSAGNTASSSISVSTERQVEETDTFVIEKNIPVITGGHSPLVDAKINSTLQQSIDTLVRDFKQEIEGVKTTDGPSVGTNSSKSAGQNNQKHSLSISMTQSNTIGDKFLTVTLADFSYISGAAHPITTTLSYNFDLSSGKLLTLEDIFDGGKNYLGTISTIAKAKLKTQLSALVNENGSAVPEKNIDASTTADTSVDSDTDGMNQDSVNNVFFEEGADPREENYSVYLIEKEGIKFIFGQYQVAPYVYGEQEVFISYADLSDVIRPSFVFSKTQ